MRYHQLGLLHHDPGRSFAGYTLVTPLRHSAIFLVDMEGAEVHRWELPGPLGSKAYLLPGGHLLFSTFTQEGTPIKEATSLLYLGSVIDEHGRSDSEVSRKLGVAKADFRVLAKVWRHANLPKKDKLQY